MNTVINTMVKAERLAYPLKLLADSYRVSVNFLRLEIQRGRLRPTYLGRRVLVSRVEAERYLRESESR